MYGNYFKKSSTNKILETFNIVVRSTDNIKNDFITSKIGILWYICAYKY